MIAAIKLAYEAIMGNNNTSYPTLREVRHLFPPNEPREQVTLRVNIDRTAKIKNGKACLEDVNYKKVVKAIESFDVHGDVAILKALLSLQ